MPRLLVIGSGNRARKEKTMAISTLAGKPAPKELLANVALLEREYAESFSGQTHLEAVVSEVVQAEFAKVGIDTSALAAQLQDEGAKSFVKSWNELMAVIASKSATLVKAG